MSIIQPSSTILAANAASSFAPSYPTSVTLISTTPSVTVNQFTDIPQLPTSSVTALVSQQAVLTSNLSSAEKINFGVTDSITGVTLDQLSAPGQIIKPGAGDFIKNLQQSLPNVPLDQVSSSTLLTGAAGITNPSDIISNVNAQVGAITQSISSSTIELSAEGLLSGVTPPTGAAGAIFANAFSGVTAVADVLKNPESAINAVAGQGGLLGKVISSGNFASSLADKSLSGLNGVSTSLSGLANDGVKGLTDGLSSGLSDLKDKASGLFNSLTAQPTTIMEKAFLMAEKSFGTLKAGIPNELGGLKGEGSQQFASFNKLLGARAELTSAQRELEAAKKEFAENSNSEDAYTRLRSAETNLANASKKVGTSEMSIFGAIKTTVLGEIGDISGISAQAASALSAAGLSGQLNLPTTANTGINALPGGLGSFAAQVTGSGANAITALKGIGNAAGAAVSGAFKEFGTTGAITGNFTGGLEKTLDGFKNGITGAVGSAGSAVTGLLGAGGPVQGVLSAVGGPILANINGIAGNLGGLTSSVGNLPGQLKSAIISNDTFAKANAVIKESLKKTLDPRVPVPNFSNLTSPSKFIEVNRQNQTIDGG